MGGVINMTDAAWRELRNHLLPPDSQLEEGAFLLARHTQTVGQHLVFQHLETILLRRSDFNHQQCDYLELTDEARARVIKRAHDNNASLIEFHSHPGPYPACLSQADMQGLREFVPHVLWRLKQRPYAAVVVAPSGFDGLVWSPPDRQPVSLHSVTIDGISHPATGLSIHALTRRVYESV